MTIHSSHPFPTPEDAVRRLRGHVGGTVSLWTAGSAPASWAGLTVSSWMVANGEPGRVIGLVDPDSDLADALAGTGLAVVQLLSWRHRDLAEAFAGTAPAPGGPFRMEPFSSTPWGPRLDSAATWAGVEVESATEVGWSLQVTATIADLAVGDDQESLFHRRGRYSTL